MSRIRRRPPTEFWMLKWVGCRYIKGTAQSFVSIATAKVRSHSKAVPNLSANREQHVLAAEMAKNITHPSIVGQSMLRLLLSLHVYLTRR